jgi:hypothetical protein
MSGEITQLSNPFSAGGGGNNFENQVQSAFVVLMLTGGAVPCLRPWPIKRIKLQGRYEEYKTDDFIAFVEERAGGQKAKLLAQIKHSVGITEGDPTFSKVIQAAWKDFQNPEYFDPRTDVIALITGPLSANDIENVRVILDWARHSENAQEFLSKVGRANFSNDVKRDKLKAFRSQLNKANDGTDVSDEQLLSFLKSFHLLGYDLDVESGVTLSLLNSHVAQFDCGDISGLWAKVSRHVASSNQNAGTITHDTIPDEIKTAFAKRVSVAHIPERLLKKKKAAEKKSVFPAGDEANALMYATLLGSWSDKSDGDMDTIQKLIERK